jgi:ATP synthase protein I
MPDADSPEDGADPRDRLEALDRAVKGALDQRAAEQREAEAREVRARQAQAGGSAWRIASNLVLAPTLLGIVGYGLDQAAGSGPWGLLTGLVLGFASGVWMAYRASMRMQAQEDKAAGGDAKGPAQDK